ncbi:alpha/beta fold hydrolase [Streptoalloteichus hindustanus]|uniref:Pimeloyl-ACP methyl ester carboxylesterase n=1 Tax=Streptoalloteichus hindustanus TaxID=2017 RepID=A0A1M5D4Y0_STRHI|nr:alpha/beta fold hydrolase [Streptoalloteichus hindustanus]SHF61732.1 Pimeloyl-ACP methyl ester carboxylesterase [Streptoalloteichus hindustanus]
MRTIEQRAAEFERIYRSGEHDGWRYYTAGQGDVVLLLPGGAGIGISWVDLALALAPTHRTITVDYPPTPATLADLADGVLGVLDAEGIDRAHVVGQSAGGMLAEVLTQRAPDRVASLVFSGTGLYGPEDVDRLAGKLAGVRATPWEQTLDAARSALRAAWRDSADADFWIGQVEAAYHRAGPEGLANSCAMLLDLAQHSHELRPGWEGPALLLAAADDPLITPTHRQRLLDLHPGCELRVFPDGGHSLLLTRPSDYLAEVTRHLAEVTTSA